MKVGGISIGNEIPDDDRTLEQFTNDPLAESPLGKLLIALAGETIWSGEFVVCAYLGRSCPPYLLINHPAFIDDLSDVISEGPDATIDGVKEVVLAHIGALLEDLQKQSAALQLKSASLSDAQGHIFKAVAKAAVIARIPEAAGCREFAPYGGSDLTCFILGHGFGHTIFVARGARPEFKGGIVQIDMPGDEWIRLEFAKKYEVFWAELARAFAARELKIPKDYLYWQKTCMKEDLCQLHAIEVLLRRHSVNEQIVVTFDADSLPTKVARVLDNENAEV